MTCFFVSIAAADFVDVDGGCAEDDGFGSHGTRVQSRRYVYQNHVLIVSTPGCPLSPSQTTSFRWGPPFIADEECRGSLHIVHSLDRNMNTIGFQVRRQFRFGRDKAVYSQKWQNGKISTIMVGRFAYVKTFLYFCSRFQKHPSKNIQAMGEGDVKVPKQKHPSLEWKTVEKTSKL